MKRTISAVLCGALTLFIFMLGLLSPAYAIFIDNGIPVGTLGHWRVDILNGGESRTANLTAQRFASNDIFTEQVLFDYFTYIDIGTGGVQLSALTTSPAALTGPNQVTSSGSFLGSNGNLINWSAVSSISGGDGRMVNSFSFATANGSPLGNLRMYQYMDEDIQGVSDDVFLTRGSVASQDLELFTVDNVEVYGVSHGGALTSAQGLLNSSFVGWAADAYDNMRPRLVAGTQGVSQAGVIASLPAFVHPQVGPAYGPSDIVSVLAWDANSAASAAAVVTTLGGVPDVAQLQAPVVTNAFVNATAGDIVPHTFTAIDPDGNPAGLTWTFQGMAGPGINNPPSFDPLTQVFEWNTAGSTAGVYTATVRATDSDGLFDDGTLTIDLEVIPEPATCMLCVLGALALSASMLMRGPRTQ